MPSFTIQLYDGFDILEWQDPADAAHVSRLNPRPGHPHQMAQSWMGVQVTIRALVGGAFVADAGLGGNLFLAWFIEYPTAVTPSPTPTAGSSAEQKYTPTEEGHYVMLMQRDDGGRFLIHWDVRDPYA